MGLVLVRGSLVIVIGTTIIVVVVAIGFVMLLTTASGTRHALALVTTASLVALAVYIAALAAWYHALELLL